MPRIIYKFAIFTNEHEIEKNLFLKNCTICQDYDNCFISPLDCPKLNQNDGGICKNPNCFHILRYNLKEKEIRCTNPDCFYFHNSQEKSFNANSYIH